MQCLSITSCYRSLIAAVIDRAIDDLKEAGPRCRSVETDRAMAFILSDTCEDYCLELEIDIEAIREIAAALYRKIIAREEKPRKARKASNPGQLPGNRIVTIPLSEKRYLKERNKKAVQPSFIFNGQSGARRSSYSVTSQLR
jgi:hypothetical protein